ncbi:MAG TPA: PQQ-binding-like beta-propeller repeat protein, partial [Acidimicrobiia bacterium]|nr:PQQ-binding-like beta-propeller repeat protein [Acidimicrobiia bacterium]
MTRRALVVVGVVLLVAFGATSASAVSTWPVYHLDNQRTGNDTSEPALVPTHAAWSAGLDASVYAQPLVFNGRVYAVTENDTVYALDAHDGRVLWKRHVGTPMTNVIGQVGCGNVDPLGILSTPVIDTARHTIFVLATFQDAPPGHIHHQLIGLDTQTGIPSVSANADPGGVQDPLYIQQRAGLALGNGRVYIGYGGYAGDCGPYHGWLVSLTESGTGKVAYNVTPHDGLGAIWETGGPAIDAAGNIFAGTGNNDPHVNTGDFGESVLKFDPTLHRLANFSSSNASGDADFGTTTPALVGGNMVFEIGKQNDGYLLDTGDLHKIQQLTVCPSSEAKGADAFDGSHLYVPCDAGIQEVNIDTVHRSMSLGWTGPGTGASGPPLLAGGALWSVDSSSGQLYALNKATGATLPGFPINIPSGVPHFAAPSAALGLVLVGTNSGVSAFAGPSGVPPHAPNACLPAPNHIGYWVASSDGNIYPFGGAPPCGSLVGTPLGSPIIAMAGKSTPGYWLAARDGSMYAFGTAHFYGSMHDRPLARPIVGLTARPQSDGYWLDASDGGIFAFGNAHFYGSMGGHPLARPIVGMAATPSGKGYWLVASDGGIFAFGDAPFFGSMGAVQLNKPVVAMAATPDGGGYWLFASDGGVFCFGDAQFLGSMGGTVLNRPIVGAAAPDAGGYWLVASDGGVFTFGDAVYAGSLGDHVLSRPIAAMAASSRAGYWLIDTNGAVTAFGDGGYFGSAPQHIAGRVVGLADGPGSGAVANGSYPSGAYGYDVSVFQDNATCTNALPSGHTIGIVEVTGAANAFPNPCLAHEAAWAGGGLNLYTFLTYGTDGTAQPGCQGDMACNWGYEASRFAFDEA